MMLVKKTTKVLEIILKNLTNSQRVLVNYFLNFCGFEFSKYLYSLGYYHLI